MSCPSRNLGQKQAKACSIALRQRTQCRQRARRCRETVHHLRCSCAAVWDDPEEFKPERFPLDGPVPTEQNTDYRYIPFSAGPRCAFDTCPPLGTLEPSMGTQH